MIHYRASIPSRHEAAKVFEYMADFANAVEWDPSVVESDRLSVGPPARGSRYHVLSRFMGRDVPLVYDVTEIDRPRRLVVRAKGGRFYSEDIIEVEPTTQGSILYYDATLSFPGLGRLAEPLFRLVFNRIGANAAAGLREHLNGSNLPGREVAR